MIQREQTLIPLNGRPQTLDLPKAETSGFRFEVVGEGSLDSLASLTYDAHVLGPEQIREGLAKGFTFSSPGETQGLIAIGAIDTKTSELVGMVQLRPKSAEVLLQPGLEKFLIETDGLSVVPSDYLFDATKQYVEIGGLNVSNDCRDQGLVYRALMDMAYLTVGAIGGQERSEFGLFYVAMGAWKQTDNGEKDYFPLVYEAIQQAGHISGASRDKLTEAVGKGVVLPHSRLISPSSQADSQTPGIFDDLYVPDPSKEDGTPFVQYKPGMGGSAEHSVEHYVLSQMKGPNLMALSGSPTLAKLSSSRTLNSKNGGVYWINFEPARTTR